MRAAERALIEVGQSEWSLMQTAGEGAARWIARVAAGHPVTVLCGPGNNGGDGYVAAAALERMGHPVTVVAPIAPASELARKAAGGFTGKVQDSAKGCEGSVFVDALFGIGLSRPLEEQHAKLMAELRVSHEYAVALDMPSGFDSDDGADMGCPCSFDLTVSFGAWKPAHFCGAASSIMGALRLVDIGVPDCGSLMQLAEAPWISAPEPRAHKYSRGLLAVIGGDMPGASLLACEAAARSAAGYVKWLSEHDHPARAADLVRDNGALDEALADKRINAFLVGPGLGRDRSARERLVATLQHDRPGVLDADALHLLQPEDLNGRAPGTLLATPHEGELAQLCQTFGIDGASKRDRAMALSDATGMVILAKGPDTLLSFQEQTLFFPPASRWLSTAGTGDVLAGIAASRLAVHGNVIEAAREAVFIHGEAAQMAGPAFTAGDLARMVSPALARFL